ncbi:MAG: SDR family NAD(P)-dependent oxidoreductase [Planctomycetota bacterium]|nr:SDR family NAD(P)-dependent oxidoreductase [Planctomycetota bacterium]
MHSQSIPLIGITPSSRPDAHLAVALSRAGAVGVIDLGLDRNRGLSVLNEALEHDESGLGALVRSELRLEPALLPAEVSLVVLAPGVDPLPWSTREDRPWRVFAQVTSLEEAQRAERAKVDALIAKGNESGGRVGNESTFILLQRLIEATDLPVYAQGGVGIRTGSACLAGGAAGLVLDAQLALVKESGLSKRIKKILSRLDGSETVEVGGHRVLRRPDIPLADSFTGESAELVASHLGGDDPERELLPFGEDAAMAAPLAAKYRTAGSLAHAVWDNAVAGLELAKRTEPLRPGGPLASEHGTAYPVVQGPMTRVSDRSAFADAVAHSGGLPFLALALTRGPQTTPLLEETAERLKDRPWGVGILGFVPKELREEQMEAVNAIRPPFALIAGGRPSQARDLEERGTKTYLHVPSPGLLEMFLADGARRFVFEGRECGGHIGPRSSFPLWEQQLALLEEFDHPEELSILFAGGIHDGRSAAMISALAAPLAERGARVGVLMGTSYLFTEEIVSSGALLPGYQEQAILCEETVLLETAPGHATRCTNNEYVKTFIAERERLKQEGVETREAWAQLEQLNLGRLRLASKGLRREGDALVEVSPDEQRDQGMFMIGEVAGLRDSIGTIEDLHRSVSEGASEHLASITLPENTRRINRGIDDPYDIAIIGMDCVFPGSPNLESYWRTITTGADTISEVDSERWNPEIYFDPDGRPGYTTPSKWGGFIDPVEIDPMSYGIPPKAMAAIEPVQVLSLEIAKRALEDAGYGDREFDREHTSVIFGAEGGNDLSSALGFRALFPQFAGVLPEALDKNLPEPTEDSFPGVLANVIAGRIANRLDLGGLNFTVDAACASALAALEAAIQTLVANTSEMVLVGGADLHNSINDYLMFSSVQALSRTGNCRSFDSKADGITLGEGVGVVVLKRLKDAERDGDHIYAVIKGCAGSSDGKSLGMTAPRLEGQVRAMERAWKRSGVPRHELGLMEAHGTGTVVGDRTEMESMSRVFGDHGPSIGSCALGSVKSQIGHTKCAAGVASLIKVCLALDHAVLPPTLHIEKPNLGWDPKKSPFHFRGVASPWPKGPEARRVAAVSSFGFGGTNFHTVLTDYSNPLDDDPVGKRWPSELFCLRANDEAALNEQLRALLSALEVERPWRLRDLAASVSQGDEPVQLAFVASSIEELRAHITRALNGEKSEELHRRSEDKEISSGQVAFLFSGQGSQYPGMCAELFVSFPCLGDLLSQAGAWHERIFPPTSFTPEANRAAIDALTDTRVAQPALGLVDSAIARLLERVGVKADHLAGHSYGELVALSWAGALPADRLLEISEARANSILNAAGEDPGTMAAVNGTKDEIEAALSDIDGIVLANQNAPNQVVISGRTDAIEAAIELLNQKGIAARKIQVACAFHSPVIEGARDSFRKVLEELPIQSPKAVVWSNADAAPYPAGGDVRDRLADHLISPVRFSEQVQAMHEAGARIFIEVGPGQVLTGLVKKILRGRSHEIISTDKKDGSSLAALLDAVARLACLGVEITTDALFAGRDPEIFDLNSPPDRSFSKMAWLVNGFRAVPAHGEAPRESYRPMDRPPEPVTTAASGAPALAANSREAVVLEYLKGMRESVRDQRDVVLGYLGAQPVPREVIVTPAPAAATPLAAAAATPPVEEAKEVEVDLEAALLKIVSERTGYPEDMLDFDLDLEADLGIDSIKRIEILGALGDSAGLAGADEAARDALVEELAAIKTLRGILDWLRENEGADTDQPEEELASPEEPDEISTSPITLRRFLLKESATQSEREDPSVLAGKRFHLVEDDRGVARALALRLEAAGAEVQSAESEESSDALIHLGALTIDAGPDRVKDLFRCARAAAEHDPSWILAATGLGGTFGRDENGGDHKAQGGAAGFMRSLAKERPNTRVRCLDLDITLEPDVLAAHLFDELLTKGSEVEVGHATGSRSSLRPVEAQLKPLVGAALLDTSSVVLLTGGARGITALVAKEIAARYSCGLVLVGRSALPELSEDAELNEALDANALRRILATRMTGSRPAEIEREVKRLLANREVSSTLDALRAAGSTVDYRCCDVRDESAFGALIDSVYKDHGRIDGVVHGAGVIEDKLLAQKSDESFDRVFDTKVRGALVLAEKLRDDVGFVAFFSSISAAFGNRGQTDYAAANDLLDKLAHALDRRLKGRVVSFNWGPWDGSGMVSDDLRREYQRRGLGLIDPKEGVAAFLDELSQPEGPAQVIVMSATAMGLPL